MFHIRQTYLLCLVSDDSAITLAGDYYLVQTRGVVKYNCHCQKRELLR